MIIVALTESDISTNLEAKVFYHIKTYTYCTLSGWMNGQGQPREKKIISNLFFFHPPTDQLLKPESL